MRKYCILAIILTLLVALCSGCLWLDLFNTPPTIDSVDQTLQDNLENIQIVIVFMVNSGYEDIYINDTSGTMLADLTRMQIPNESITHVVTQLLNSGPYKSISKCGNTISLLQWTGISDIGCGIAYTINGTDLPTTDYLTQLEPLSIDNWYYYVDDFNEWRLRGTEDGLREP